MAKTPLQCRNERTVCMQRCEDLRREEREGRGGGGQRSERLYERCRDKCDLAYDTCTKTPRGGCSTDADCRPGYKCVDGVCKKPIVSGSPCPDPATGYLRPINGTCKGGESNVKSSDTGLWWCCPGKIIKECQDDADCIKAHGEGWKCGPDGKCYAVKCTKDSDCKAGEWCDNGVCRKIIGCTKDSDCPTGYVCKDGKCVKKGGCTKDSDCPTGQICKNGVCKKKGDGDGDGEQFGWSPEIQALLARILDRANSLLDQPLGLSEEERQAIYNRIFEKIKGTERPAIQSAMDVASRQGLLGSPYAERRIPEIQRGTREQLAAAERDIEIQEAQDRYQQLLGTTSMAQSLLGTGMGAEQLVEAANAARRGEGTSSLNSILQYLISVGGQNSTYYQALLNWLTTHQG